MRVLVILAHADPAVLPLYRERLPDHCDVVVANARTGVLSSAYDRLGQKLVIDSRSSPHQTPVLRELAAYAGAPDRLGAYDRVVLASYSAGYALVRTMLEATDELHRIDAVVSIDSWHAGLESDGTARDSQLGGLVQQALRAKEEPFVCAIGHTDVKTHGAYASTEQVATEVVRLSGGTGGGFFVESHDHHKSPKTEHGAALTEWGPTLVARAVSLLNSLRERRAPATPQSVPVGTLGSRALAIARRDQLAGVREIPGPKRHPRIAAYLKGCMRNGKPVGLTSDETAWCAAAVSACAFEAAIEGERVPHRWRISVLELWMDAIEYGSAIGAQAVRNGMFIPRAGDVAIMTRGGPARGEGVDAFAATNGRGHTGRITDWVGDGTYRTLDGNVKDAWTDVDRSIQDPAFIGIIAYPGHVLRTPTDGELDGLDALRLAELDRVSDAVERGEGFDEIGDILSREIARIDRGG